MNTSFPGTGPAFDHRISDVENVRDLLGAFLNNNQAEAIRLLQINGIDISKSASTKTVYTAFLKGLKDNEPFRNQVSQILASRVVKNQMGFIAQPMLNLFGEEEVQSMQPAAQPAGKEDSGSFWSSLGKVFSPDLIQAGIKTGLNSISTSMQAKANSSSEQNALELERLRLQQIQAQTEANKAKGASEGFPTWGKVVLGIVGVGALVTIVVVIVRKKKAA